MNMKITKFGGTSPRNEMTRRYVYRHVLESSKANKVIIVVLVTSCYPGTYVMGILPSMNSEFLIRQEEARPVSMREQLSALRVCGELLDTGVWAYAFPFSDYGILTNENYDYAKVLRLNHTGIREKLSNYDILAVGGFIGTSPSGYVTTLGRGGDDYSAVLFADMLDLKEVNIYTGVDGVYDKDLRLNEYVAKCDKLIYDEMPNMKSRILHDRCVNYARDHHIRTYLKRTFSTSLGTIVEDQILLQLMNNRINHWVVYRDCDAIAAR